MNHERAKHERLIHERLIHERAKHELKQASAPRLPRGARRSRLLKRGRSVRVSHICLDLDVRDLNTLLAEFLPEPDIRVVDIRTDGVHGHVRLWWWNIDFVARPCASGPAVIAVDVSAHKLVPIPSAIVHFHLREAMKDAPPGVDVIRQTLTVHLPSVLKPFGLSLEVQEFRAHDGYIRIVADNVEWNHAQRFFRRVDSVPADTMPPPRRPVDARWPAESRSGDLPPTSGARPAGVDAAADGRS
ncbi:MAG: hypothetical protein K6T30_04670 [Alicyclobacillus sp.]|nr:hypothetical protein [Alicyclobacillus sp.]